MGVCEKLLSLFNTQLRVTLGVMLRVTQQTPDLGPSRNAIMFILSFAMQKFHDCESESSSLFTSSRAALYGRAVFLVFTIEIPWSSRL